MAMILHAKFENTLFGMDLLICGAPNAYDDLEGPAIQWCNFCNFMIFICIWLCFCNPNSKSMAWRKQAEPMNPGAAPKRRIFFGAPRGNHEIIGFPPISWLSQTYGYVFAIQILDYITWSLEPGIDSCTLLIVHDSCPLPQIMQSCENRMNSCSN